MIEEVLDKALGRPDAVALLAMLISLASSLTVLQIMRSIPRDDQNLREMIKLFGRTLVRMEGIMQGFQSVVRELARLEKIAANRNDYNIRILKILAREMRAMKKDTADIKQKLDEHFYDVSVEDPSHRKNGAGKEVFIDVLDPHRNSLDIDSSR